MATDRESQFFVMLGSCCESARLAHLPIRLEFADGTIVEGVPTGTAVVGGASDEQIGHTGTAATIGIDGTDVDLVLVRGYFVARP